MMMMMDSCRCGELISSIDAVIIEVQPITGDYPDGKSALMRQSAVFPLRVIAWSHATGSMSEFIGFPLGRVPLSSFSDEDTGKTGTYLTPNGSDFVRTLATMFVEIDPFSSECSIKVARAESPLGNTRLEKGLLRRLEAALTKFTKLLLRRTALFTFFLLSQSIVSGVCDILESGERVSVLLLPCAVLPGPTMVEDKLLSRTNVCTSSGLTLRGPFSESTVTTSDEVVLVSFSAGVTFISIEVARVRTGSV